MDGSEKRTDETFIGLKVTQYGEDEHLIEMDVRCFFYGKDFSLLLVDLTEIADLGRKLRTKPAKEEHCNEQSTNN